MEKTKNSELSDQSASQSKLIKHGKNRAIKHCVTIKKAPLEVFSYWRDLRNLPSFMKDLESLEVLTDKTSLWKMKAERGPASTKTVSWTAEITQEIPGRSLSWKSVKGSEVENSGSVTFTEATGQRGTVVSLEMDFSTPGGRPAEFIAKLYGEDPSTLSLINLRRLKAKLETGEIPTTDGQPSGRETDK